MKRALDLASHKRGSRVWDLEAGGHFLASGSNLWPVEDVVPQIMDCTPDSITRGPGTFPLLLQSAAVTSEPYTESFQRLKANAALEKDPA